MSGDATFYPLPAPRYRIRSTTVFEFDSLGRVAYADPCSTRLYAGSFPSEALCLGLSLALLGGPWVAEWWQETGKTGESLSSAHKDSYTPPDNVFSQMRDFTGHKHDSLGTPTPCGVSPAPIAADIQGSSLPHADGTTRGRGTRRLGKQRLRNSSRQAAALRLQQRTHCTREGKSLLLPAIAP